MPKQGEYDLTYINKLKLIGIVLLEPYKGAKAHHNMKCTECSSVWNATPIAKIQAFNKWRTGGCPACSATRRLKEYQNIRQQNIEKLTNRGFDILSEWDGTTGLSKDAISLPVTVRNTNCGHTFTSASKNLLTRNVTCPVCAQQLKTKNINDSSKQRSDHWALSAPEWKQYRSNVTKLTKLSYKQHKDTINPNNLPTGRAGTMGAYHLDHIVPVRYCFDNNIPIHVCSHWSNLQMLNWKSNVGSRDKLKPNVKIPDILREYIVVD